MNLPELPASIRAHPQLGDWVRVRDDGHIEVFSGKVELGQGISAALLKIACVTLGVGVGQIHLVAGDTGRSPNEGYTSGSQSIEVGGAALQHACTALRRLCAAAATRRWQLPPDSLQVVDGWFETIDGTRRASYLELAGALNADALRIDQPLPDADIDARLPDPATAFASDASDAFSRADLPAKLSGAGYVHDLVLDGMLHARVLRGPHPQSRPGRVDAAALQALAGVQALVRQGDFLALVGPDEARIVAAAAAASQAIDWNLPPLPTFGEVEAVLTRLPAVSTIAHTSGPADPPAGVRRLRRRYSRPYIAHAAIGASCAVAAPASVQAGTVLTVWSHTQGSFQLRAEIAEALGLPPGEVRIVHTAGAGCYGHNGADDVAFDAALLAHTLNLPVRVQWSREDELTVSPVGPASLIEIEAGLDADGMISHWHAQVWSHSHLSRPGATAGLHLLGAWACDPDRPRPLPTDVPLPNGGGLRNAIPGYALPAVEVQHHFIADAPLRVSALRSLGAHANVFAAESFMDELAATAGIDPVEFRLRHLSDARARHVVSTAARLAGWPARPPGGEGHGFGIGYARYKNRAGYLAVVVEVVVEASVQVRRVWAAVDVGRIVHRDGLLNQIEGGIVQALSWSLKESVRWGPEGVVTSGWETYPIASFAELPEVVIELVDRPEEASLGAGELAPGPVAGALGNAVAHALGLRARHLPLSPERLLALIHGDSAMGVEAGG